MLCPKCHTNNPDGEKYCKNCGFQLNAFRVCPECGTYNNHDTKFCHECGAHLSPVNSFKRNVIDDQNTSFFNKYQSFIIAAVILVLAVGAVTGIALYNSSSGSGRSDDGFSFAPLANDTNSDDSQLDDGNDTNQSVNGTNKTSKNDTAKNKTADKNKDVEDKNKNSSRKSTELKNNTASSEINKSVESVANKSNVNASNDDNKSSQTSSNSKDKSLQMSSSHNDSSLYASKASSVKSSSNDDKSSKASSVKSSSNDDKSSLDVNQASSSHVSSDDDDYEDGYEDYEVGEDDDEDDGADEDADEESNEIDAGDVLRLAKEAKSAGYSFSTIELDGREFSKSQCIAIFADYISSSRSGSIEIPDVSPASSPSGEDLSQSVSKKDYLSIANEVSSYASSNGRIPDNAVVYIDEEESDISPDKILELFANVIIEGFPESVDI